MKFEHPREVGDAMSHENKVVLVGTSLNEQSDGVLGAALNIARGWGAGLQVFHAYPLPVAYFVAPTGMTAVSPNLIDTDRARGATIDPMGLGDPMGGEHGCCHLAQEFQFADDPVAPRLCASAP